MLDARIKKYYFKNEEKGFKKVHLLQKTDISISLESFVVLRLFKE